MNAKLNSDAPTVYIYTNTPKRVYIHEDAISRSSILQRFSLPAALQAHVVCRACRTESFSFHSDELMRCSSDFFSFFLFFFFFFFELRYFWYMWRIRGYFSFCLNFSLEPAYYQVNFYLYLWRIILYHSHCSNNFVSSLSLKF